MKRKHENIFARFNNDTMTPIGKPVCSPIFLWKSYRDSLHGGELIARGFAEPSSHGAPYLTISRHEWQILKLDPQGDQAARGGGVGYIGLTIGKPGTRSFFRRRG
jgi:hypothetical protein